MTSDETASTQRGIPVLGKDRMSLSDFIEKENTG